MTAWFFLICGGIFEIIWAVSLKYLDGFNKITPIIVMLSVIVSILSDNPPVSKDSQK
jgi:quaternary ammonium compound-resistance protein SugE